MCDYERGRREREVEEGEGGGVKWQRKMSRGRAGEDDYIFSNYRAIQDIRHKYI